MSRISRFQQIPDEIFADAVANSEFIRDILITLGYSRNSGAMYPIIKQRIKRQNLDTSHLGFGRGKVTRRGGEATPKYDLDEILVEKSTYSNGSYLKKRILEAGLLQEQCSVCGLGPEWCGYPLTLQLDHINGINDDNRIENLRILCPNCHTQTNTYGSKNGK